MLSTHISLGGWFFNAVKYSWHSSFNLSRINSRSVIFFALIVKHLFSLFAAILIHLQGENIIQRDDRPVLHDQSPLRNGDMPNPAGDGHIRATGFPVIGNEVFDGHFRMVRQTGGKFGRDGGSVLRPPAGPVRAFRRSAGQFPCRRLVARQRGKRRELCGPFAERHLRMVLRDVVRQVDDVIVGRLHFRCPPICSFRSLPVAPSTKFVPFRMAFFPIRFLMPMIACCRRFSLPSSACSSAFCFFSASESVKRSGWLAPASAVVSLSPMIISCVFELFVAFFASRHA